YSSFLTLRCRRNLTDGNSILGSALKICLILQRNHDISTKEHPGHWILQIMSDCVHNQNEKKVPLGLSAKTRKLAGDMMSSSGLKLGTKQLLTKQPHF
ncbi:hypothetical protein JRQ81_002688, partial [Phrynocephalus forsythii]